MESRENFDGFNVIEMSRGFQQDSRVAVNGNEVFSQVTLTYGRAANSACHAY